MKKVNLDFVVSKASGNVTAFVVYPVDPRLRVAYGKQLMEELKKEFNVEQVGFIAPSFEDKPLRLDMMGGEFCGNATRSYGYYCAQCEGVEGKKEMEVYVSGHQGPLYVNVDLDKKTAEVEMPRAKKLSVVEINGTDYNAVVFDGIAHVVVEQEEDEKLAKEIIKELQTIYETEAYGVLFFNKEKEEMVPYVYVKEADTFVREGSCGSGTAAIATLLTRNFDGDLFEMSLKQPDGVIDVRAEREKDGEFIIYIGGEIEITEKEQIIFEVPDEAFAFVKKAKDEQAKKIRENMAKEKAEREKAKEEENK